MTDSPREAPGSHGGRPGNPDRLRAAIDSGATGDKVDFPDPAAAPLGADDEAAGFPPTRSQVQEAEAREIGRTRSDDSGRGGRMGALAAMVLVIVAAIAVILAAIWAFG
jgi:hypothetical protein